MKKKASIIICFIIIAIIGGYSFYNKNQGTVGEVNIKTGILSGYTEEEINEIVNRDVDRNAFSFEINGRPIFQDGKSEGNLRIANPPYSYYAIEVEIYLEESEELIFESGKMNPNEYIEYAKLKKQLEKGQYDAVAIIKAYDIETYEYKGQSAAGLIITVNE